MSVKRSRTDKKNGEKIQYFIEYGLDSIDLYVAYGDRISIRYKDIANLTEYQLSNKLLKLFYRLLGFDISDIERTLKVKIGNGRITDREGNKIDIVNL